MAESSPSHPATVRGRSNVISKLGGEKKGGGAWLLYEKCKKGRGCLAAPFFPFFFFLLSMNEMVCVSIS